ncbi:hypothetical protein IFM89_013143 [Coptis chinensis]|uniref:dihydropyrimidine dehydrogenase (NADP(+)) n=1 Tax=Coptis chinensis TaxID=261450 RepID=A0A835IQM0_9MAGN|nr:hypothetical protein IFM89_013143 [Coptis chinensis]
MDENKRDGPTSRGQALVDEYGIEFFEMSTKTNLNVEHVFFSITRDIKQRLAKSDSNAEPQTIKISKPDPNKEENFNFQIRKNPNIDLHKIHIQQQYAFKQLKEEYPDQILIASVMEEYDKHAWEELIDCVEQTRVDYIEVNFSCPHGMPERRMGALVGQDCVLLEEFCDWVNAKGTIPVWAKMTPNITDIT